MKNLRVAFFSDMLVRDHDGCMRTVFHILDRKPDTVEFKYFAGAGSVKGLNEPYVPVRNFRIPFNSDYRMAVPLLSLDSLKKQLDQYAPDLIHITSPSALGQFALDYAVKRGIPVSTIYHTHYLSYTDFYLSKVPVLIPFVKHLVGRQTRSFYQKCDLVLVPTPQMKLDLQALGVPSHKMKIWERGIDKQVFNPAKKNKEKLQALTDNNKPTLLFASRLVWEKNLATLVDIYALCTQKGLDYNFLIIGDGTAYAELKRKMPDAIFTGKVPQSTLAELYASADVFVFPSISETYGNVVTEAMACGLPCVIADGGGTRDLIDQAHTGYRVSAYDAEAYVEKITQLLEDRPLRQAIINAALRFVDELSWQALVDRYFDQLKQLVSRRQHTARSLEA